MEGSKNSEFFRPQRMMQPHSEYEKQVAGMGKLRDKAWNSIWYEIFQYSYLIII